jgi:hypothetical protein
MTVTAPLHAPAPAARSRSGRPRVVIAPVTVTPTKPLGPSHLKGLLWTDVMVRATQGLADVTYRSSQTSYLPSEQTLAFWEYLDHAGRPPDWASLSEEEIGERYVAFHAGGRRPSPAALRPYADAVERGWVHPASRRVLEIWAGQFAGLGLVDPGLTVYQPPGMTLAEVLSWLDAHELCLDHRPYGGPVYLDATRHGLPLRQIVDSEGRANYLACALRDLVPLLAGHDEVVLVHDRDLTPDYLLLQRALDVTGTAVRRVALGRVPVDGRIRSARYGTRGEHTAETLLGSAFAGHDDPVVRLGLRLYFVAMLGPGQTESLRPDIVRSCLHRAQRLLAQAAPEPAEPITRTLGAHRGRGCYVDAYRLTSGLLARHRGAPSYPLLSEVYL